MCSYFSPALACSAVALVSSVLQAQTVQSTLPLSSETLIALPSRRARTSSLRSFGGSASSTFSVSFESAANEHAVATKKVAAARVRVMQCLQKSGGMKDEINSSFIPHASTSRTVTED